MSLPVEFLDEAEQELRRAFAFYNQRPGSGQKFLDAVDAETDPLASTPLLWPEMRPGLRRAVVRKYPYVLIYKPLAHRVEVVLVFHTSQDPAKLDRRLDELAAEASDDEP